MIERMNELNEWMGSTGEHNKVAMVKEDHHDTIDSIDTMDTIDDRYKGSHPNG